MFSKLRLRKRIAYLLIWCQLLTPGLSLFPVITHASERSDIQGTIQKSNSLNLANKYSVRTSSQSTTATTSRSALITQPGASVLSPHASDYFPIQTPAPASSSVAKLPSLSSLKAPSDETTSPSQQTAGTGEGDHRLASGAAQMGSMLYQNNTSDAAMNYARSIGEDLINQQIRDWLNQHGSARVSLGTHHKLSADLLVPLAETDQRLMFSQVGVRTNQDRHTVNLGVGYRQYINDWMLGINTFYDYDYTGKNKRIGVGAEAWTDYLKLAANGYIRQTHWHQSKLGDMEDYDERPANGFDLRANAYLPAWPNIGGSLKYEQYFGKGVSVAERASSDTLKDNPVVVTMGVDYTPFPLMTLSAKRSVGDSQATNVGVDFSYRFGVPWLQQIDPDAVGLMRSLAGSKYDFVDRNYNIVMQYRKQALLTISLPAAMTVQAAETVSVILTVSKAKYGLKSVSWNVDPLLTARGGRYQQVSPTELQVTVPADVSGQRQYYTISAVATDNNGNQSNTAETIIGVLPSENTLGRLTISPNDRILAANDSDSYAVTGTVTNDKGTPLSNQNVTFNLNGLINSAGQAGTTLAPVGGGEGDSRQLTVTTGLDGKATVMLRSKVAGEGQITATMGDGNVSTTKVRFAADSATAAVRKVTLMDDSTTKIADIKNSFTYTALVQDKFGNTVVDTSVIWAVDAAGVTLSALSTLTDSNGNATVKLQSSTRVATNIMVSAHTTEQLTPIDADKKVSFIAGDIAADKSTLTASPDSIIASGQDTSSLTLTLVDINNNPISGMANSLGTTVTGLDNVSVSDFAEQDIGVYVATLTGTKAGIATITAISGRKQVSMQTPKVTLNADKATAQITDGNLIIAPDDSIADGQSTNGVKVMVTDNQGNSVSGMTVTFSVSSGAILTTVNGETDAQGVATATVTSTRAGSYTVTASVNGQSITKDMTFVANVATAHVSDVVLIGSVNTLPANGQNSFNYTATVTDNQGNPIAGARVIPKSDKTGVTIKANTVTDNQGQTTITLTSTTLAVASITVSAQVGTTPAVSAGTTVSFIADSASAQVESVILNGSDVSKAADGKNNFSYTVTVTDSHDNPVEGATIVPAADQSGVTLAVSGVTDTRGQARITLTSTTLAVANITVSAQVGNTASINADVAVSFTADSALAQVASVVLNGSDVSKVADGNSTFTYTVTVTDSHHNLVTGAVVVPMADQSGVAVTVSGVTNTRGQATITLTSTPLAVANITVSAQVGTTPAVSAATTVSFIADSASAQVASVILNGSDVSKAADGKNTFTYTVTVTDRHDNPVEGGTVVPAVDQSGVTVAVSGITDSRGQAMITLTSTTLAVANITVSAQVGNTASINADVAVSFTADRASAQVASVVLNGSDVSKVADGNSAFTYTVTVTDSHDNPVEGATVVPAADQSGVSVAVSGVTDTQGQARITLTSTTLAVANITVSAQVDSTASVNANEVVSFIADSATAKVGAVTLDDSVQIKVADGNNTFNYTAQIIDINGNPVKQAGLTVQWSQNKDTAVTLPSSSVTDETGQATITLSSTTSAVSNIQVSAQYLATPRVNANKVVNFTADNSQAKVSGISLVGSVLSQIADGKNFFTYTVTVTDTNSNPVLGAVVVSEADKSGVTVAVSGTTNASGQATITLTSTTLAVEDITVSAQVGNTPLVSADTKVSFTADRATATVKAVTLIDSMTNKVANGTNGFNYTAQIVDAHDNPVKQAGVTVSWSQNRGSSVTLPSSSVTDANGQARITLTSTTLAVANITVSAQVGSTTSINADLAVSFTADSASAQVASVILNGSDVSKVADGNSTFTYTVTVTDSHDNPVEGATVVPAADQSGVSVVVSGVTDTHGQARITLTSTTLAVANITVSAQVGSTTSINADLAVSFTADSASAQVASVILNGSDVSKVADGNSTFTYTVTVTDSHDNPVEGATVVPAADQSGVSVAVSGVTDTHGQARITLTSTTLAVANITVSAQVGSTTSINADLAVSFTADSASAQVASVILNGSDVSKVADGNSTFTYTVTVTDSHDNPVEGATVVPAADQSGVAVTVSGVTNTRGQATITLTSTTLAVANITVSAQVGSTTSINADVAVSFTANRVETRIDLNWVNNDKLVIANNKDLNIISGKITDIYGNIISNAEIELTLPSGVSLSSGGTLVESNNNGDIDFSISSSTSGVINITAKSTESGGSSSTNAVTYFSPVTIDIDIDFTN